MQANMHDAAQSTTPVVLRYRDPKAAVAWLRETFRCEVRSVVRTAEGKFDHADLACGGTLIRVAALDGVGRASGNPGGVSDIVLNDIEALCARAKAAGVEIVTDIESVSEGRHHYVCRDLEGHVWRFATVAHERKGALVPVEDLSARQSFGARPSKRQSVGMGVAAALTLVAGGASIWQLTMPWTEPAASKPAASEQTYDVNAALRRAESALVDEREARRLSEASKRSVLEALAEERAGRQHAQDLNERLQAELAAALGTRDAADEAVEEASAKSEWQTEAIAVAVQPAGTRPSLHHPELDEGYAALAHGDIAAARNHFRALADRGLPQAALALGSTYDPINSQRIADAETDREQAKLWYRRAIELVEATERQRAQ
jgi:uncharacterized glyoxalase superfamily protein PhnB